MVEWEAEMILKVCFYILSELYGQGLYMVGWEDEK
jgi:hypothetical protein